MGWLYTQWVPKRRPPKATAQALVGVLLSEEKEQIPSRATFAAGHSVTRGAGVHHAIARFVLVRSGAGVEHNLTAALEVAEREAR